MAPTLTVPYASTDPDPPLVSGPDEGTRPPPPEPPLISGPDDPGPASA